MKEIGLVLATLAFGVASTYSADGQTPLRYSGPDPKPDWSVAPAYPADALAARESGVSTVRTCVDASGRVTSAEIAGSSGSPALDAASVAWVSSTAFTPTINLQRQPMDFCGKELSLMWWPPPLSAETGAAPKLHPKQPALAPEYPQRSLRAAETGTTTGKACLDAEGRVESFELTQSSGFVMLDLAFEEWVRNTPYEPFVEAGAATAKCGAEISMDWRLN